MPEGKSGKSAETEPVKTPPGRQASVEARPQIVEAVDAATQNGLAQLREILFGATVRDLERRLARADAHIAARAHELELETRKRIEMVEAHLRKETDALTGRLEREFADKSETLRAMTREHRESVASVEQRVSKLEESIIRAQRELRDQLLEQGKAFIDELRQLRREFSDTLERELGLVEGVLAQEGGHREGERPSP